MRGFPTFLWSRITWAHRMSIRSESYNRKPVRNSMRSQPGADFPLGWKGLGEGGVQSTLFFAFSTTLTLFQIQASSKFVTQYSKSMYTISCQNMKATLFRKNFTINLRNGAFSVECAPCLGHTRHEHGVHLTGQ